MTTNPAFQRAAGGKLCSHFNSLAAIDLKSRLLQFGDHWPMVAPSTPRQHRERLAI